MATKKRGATLDNGEPKARKRQVYYLVICRMKHEGPPWIHGAYAGSAESIRESAKIPRVVDGHECLVEIVQSRPYVNPGSALPSVRS